MESVVSCENLICWLKTFESVETWMINNNYTSAKSIKATDLWDGVLLSQVLHEIAPDYFDQSWMSRIKTDINDNWRVRQSNLKKLLQAMIDYYSENIAVNAIENFSMPDLTEIAERGNEKELTRLIQLILGCAVNCANKEGYISSVMELEETVQHAVMTALKELLAVESSEDGDSLDGRSRFDSNFSITSTSSFSMTQPNQDISRNTNPDFQQLETKLNRTVEKLNETIATNDDMSQRCHELDQQVTQLQDENSTLSAELQDLRLRYQESLEVNTNSTKQIQLQIQVDQLKNELFKLEATQDDVKIKSDLQEKEIISLQRENEGLKQIVAKDKALQDEMDELRATSDKVTKYESTLESYKKKLEELPELRRQIASLEQKDSLQVAQIMDLETELRHAGSVKHQLDGYKKQISELTQRADEETRRADKAEFSVERAEDRLKQALKERESLISERDQLQEVNEELLNKFNLSDFPSETKSSGHLNVDDIQNDEVLSELELATLDPNIRDRFLRLNQENKILRGRGYSSVPSDSDNRIPVLESMLNDSKSRISELETENRIRNQRILQLEADLNDIQESQTNSGAMSDVQRKELENRVSDSEKASKQFQEQVIKLTDEMKVMEGKYKKYLEKAKCVIKTLKGSSSADAVSSSINRFHPQQNLDSENSPSSESVNNIPELLEFRRKLEEKDELIERLQQDRLNILKSRQQDEQLIVTAWYNLGMKLHRQAAEQRLTGMSAAISPPPMSVTSTTSPMTSKMGGGAIGSSRTMAASPSSSSSSPQGKLNGAISFLAQQRLVQNRRVSKQQSTQQQNSSTPDRKK